MEETLHIHPELMDLLPGPTDEEWEALEESIKLNKRAFVPIYVWNGYILDGHKRYEICSKLDLPYETQKIALPDLNAAKRWIIEAHLACRHLNVFQRIELAEQFRPLYEEEAKINRGWRKGAGTEKEVPVELREAEQSASGQEESNPEVAQKDEDGRTRRTGQAYETAQRDTLREAEMQRETQRMRRKKETTERLAKLACTSASTYQHAREIIKHGNEELIDKLRKGECKINTAYLIIKTQKAEMQSELDEKRTAVVRSLTKLLDAYEWFIAQSYERDGENISDLFRDSFTRMIEDNQRLLESVEGLKMNSETGNLSITEI